MKIGRIDLNRVRALADAAREYAQARDDRQRPVRDRADGAPGSWYRIENKAGDSGKPAEVYIYDEIGFWGISAQDFVNDLKQITANAVDLHVNSPGGEVFDGLAIYETIARHPANFTAYIDGMAASAASFIVQACAEVVMAKRAKMMIHDAHGFAIGNARDLRKTADLFDDLSDTIADIYADGSGTGTRASWRAAMQAAEGGPDGTWYGAQAAVDAGLADRISGDDAAEDRAPAGAAASAPARPAATWDRDAVREVIVGGLDRRPKAAIPDGAALLAALRK